MKKCNHTLGWSIAGTYCTKCRVYFTIVEILKLAEIGMRSDDLQHFQNEVLGEIGWCDEQEESGIGKSSYCVGEIRHLRELIKKHDRGVKVTSCPKCGSFGDGEKFVYCDNCGYGLR